MLCSTQGIVFHTTRYSDNSVIAKIYTHLHGLQSFIINGINRKKSPSKSSALQPLAMVEMAIYHTERKQLQKVKEIKLHYPFHSIPYDPSKRSILFFLNEILLKSIREEETNHVLFDFITNSLRILDLQAGKCANFHLSFLIQLTRYLGFFPQGIYTESTPLFDLQEGIFTSNRPSSHYYMENEMASLFSSLLNKDYQDSEHLLLTASQRKQLITYLLIYYELHLPSFKNIQSKNILEEIMA